MYVCTKRFCDAVVGLVGTQSYMCMYVCVSVCMYVPGLDEDLQLLLHVFVNTRLQLQHAFQLLVFFRQLIVCMYVCMYVYMCVSIVSSKLG